MNVMFCAAVNHYRSVERRRRHLATFNLAGGVAITVLLLLAARDTPYPPAVGTSLALLIGISLTCATVWVSLYFGRSGEPKESRGGKDRES